MRRGAWLALGAVLGASGTVWSRRRLEELASRARSGAISGDVVRLVDRGVKRVDRHVTTAIETGREEARRRRGELHRLYAPRASSR
jgi:hypothetical protein